MTSPFFFTPIARYLYWPINPETTYFSLAIFSLLLLNLGKRRFLPIYDSKQTMQPSTYPAPLSSLHALANVPAPDLKVFPRMSTKSSASILRTFSFDNTLYLINFRYTIQIFSITMRIPNFSRIVHVSIPNSLLCF